MKNGRVKLYTGKLPKSGKSVFSFGGIDLVHRSIKRDKSDYIVHLNTGAVIMIMPIGSERSIALDYIAKRIDELVHFDSNYNDYTLYEEEPIIKKTKAQLELENQKTYPTMYKKPSYSDRGCVSKPKTKRTFNTVFARW